MIKYSLKCAEAVCLNKGQFDGWFQNSDAYEKQLISGQLTCPFCGSENVSKSLMSPSIKSPKEKEDLSSEKSKNSYKPIVDQSIDKTVDVMTVLRTLKKEVQNNAEFVGNKFVSEAKAIKSGKSNYRAIYGNAKAEEIEDLKNNDIDVVSIPWIQDDH